MLDSIVFDIKVDINMNKGLGLSILFWTLNSVSMYMDIIIFTYF